MWIVLTSAHYSFRARYFKIENVALIASHTISDLLNKLFGSSRLPAPFRQQAAGKYPGIVVIIRFKFGSLLEERAPLRFAPVQVLSYPLHHDIPFGTLGGKSRS